MEILSISPRTRLGIEVVSRGYDRGISRVSSRYQAGDGCCERADMQGRSVQSRSVAAASSSCLGGPRIVTISKLKSMISTLGLHLNF